jgi:pyruvate/2-oxoglutarate dehydrogenase complex dihydrolipoamide dehydrogenase (E3) component
MKHDYDMIVIGGGSAGLVAAGMSALLGAKTLLVEQHRLGGECTWTGCIPSKALIKAAKIAHEMRHADRYGLTPATAEHDFGRVMEHVRAIRQKVYEQADAPAHFERMGVELIQADARFLDPHTVELTKPGGADQKVTSRYFVIATGSRPIQPEFAVPTLNNENLFELTSQPKRLVVLGAGPVGIEMAQAFQRLGSAVTVVAPGASILPRDEPELTALLKTALEADGISFVLGKRVTAGQKDGETLTAILDNGDKLPCDALLAAIGREGNIKSLGLKNAGVATAKNYITVDDRCRTSQHHIYASGDVTGRYQFTHMAEHMSKVAVTNAILHYPKRADERCVTWATFADPELAHLGSSEEDLSKRGTKFSVYRFPFGKIDRAVVEVETTGRVKVLADASGRMLGASILGARAGEMIAEWALAMRNGVRLKQISDTIHPYPTYMLGNRQAADRWNSRRLDSPLLGWLGKLLGYRGVRKGAAAL